MCCTNNSISINKFKSNYPNKDIFIPVYKRLEISYNSYIGKRELKSPSVYKIWTPGIHVDVKEPRIQRNAKRGIHVYLTNDKKSMGYRGVGRKTVKLYALASSVIAVNGNHAVFGTVLLTQKEYDKATRQS